MHKNLAGKKIMKMDHLTLGVCYYPEHWEESIWSDDLERMREHGIEVIRIAEFAWNKFEPEEGVFTFEFFDRFLDLAFEKGIKVIFCTPTATPPAWLTYKYPEVLNAREDGVLYRHGNRRHYTYNSPKYNELSARIVEEMARHYCPHPAIIGWQIDNELNCHIDQYYSEADHIAFRAYLKQKFETLDALNEAMGTTFWNQTYTAWEEIFLSRPNVANSNNPHMVLEEKRFISESTLQYCKMQADIIEKYRLSHQFITTNSIFGHMDCHEMTNSCLDFIMYDSYPNFAFDTWTEPKKPGNLNDRRSSWSLTRARSISPVFGIMEQQAGAGGWDSMMKQPAPKPGQMRLWTFQSLAHGADFISYFRWRTSWIGTEIYWHGLNDYGNRPNRRLEELKVIRDDLKRIDEIKGSIYKAKVALLKDYANAWDGEQDKWHGPLDEFSDNGWFSAAQYTHTPLDFIYLQDRSRPTTLEDLQEYELIIYAHATILTKETAALLTDYVKNGGTLIMGARTGYKDEFGRCPMQQMPGHASLLCGVEVEDYTHLGPDDDDEYVIWNEECIPAPVFNDILRPLEGASVLATFKGNYYDGAPALVRNSLGAGNAYYFGAGFDTGTAETFLRNLGFSEPYSNIVELPKEAELTVRGNEENDYLFILNYKPYDIRINVKEPLIDMVSGENVSGEVNLGKYGVMVLKSGRSM